MKKTGKRVLAAISAMAMIIGMATGCGQNSKTPSSSTPETSLTENQTLPEAPSNSTSANTEKDLSGSIAMSGSTSMEKMVNALSEAFMQKYDQVTVTAEFIGSGAGIEAVTNGIVDIGNSSRNLKEEEKANGIVENIVAIDGIAIITDKANTVTNLTKDQLISIYKGEITNWSELGGAGQPIVVVGREAGSGTRGAFEEILSIEDECVYASELDNTGAVMAKVASTPGAIGYVSFDVIDDSVMVFHLEGIEASAENIKNGSYFLSRPFVMATKGAVSEQSELIQAFFEYLISEEGKAIIEKVGLIASDFQP